MQGSFSVWISYKRAATRMKELARFKPMQRHLFLYERALLFCKRREEHGEGCDKTPSYSFKHCLKVCLCVCVCLLLYRSRCLTPDMHDTCFPSERLPNGMFVSRCVCARACRHAHSLTEDVTPPAVPMYY